jgi:hypothetical protein
MLEGETIGASHNPVMKQLVDIWVFSHAYHRIDLRLDILKTGLELYGFPTEKRRLGVESCNMVSNVLPDFDLDASIWGRHGASNLNLMGRQI